MALRIRRGTEAQRTSVAPFDMGEIVWTTDTERLYVGDGITSGGKNILANSAGNGLVFNAVTQRLDVGNFNITTDDVPEGTQPGRQYHTVERAQAAAASLFTTGAHNGISFTYQDANNRIDATVSLSLDALSDVVITGTPTTGYVLKYDGTKWAPAPDIDTDTDTGILAVVDDLTPELGGNLSLNSKNIVGDGNLNFTGNIDLIGDGETTGNITAPGSLEVTGTVIATSGLGANLNLNSYDITGTGNVDIAGSLSATGINTSSITSGSNDFSVNVNSSEYIAQFYGLTTGSSSPRIALRATAGNNVAFPINTSPGARLGQYIIEGYADDTWKKAVAIYGVWDETADLTDDNPASSVAFITNNGTGVNYGLFTSQGAFSAPVIHPRAFATEAERNAALATPEDGMMTYIRNICKFQGYVLDTGLAAGGPANETPGWVNLN